MTSPSGLWTEGDTLSPTNLNRRNPVGTFPAKTYHVAWAAGTGTTQINNAIVNAAAGGYNAVFIDASRLPYDASAVTFNNAVHMMREGGTSRLDQFDAVAYGAAEDGSTDAVIGLQAALDAAGAHAATVRGAEVLLGNSHALSKPAWLRYAGVTVKQERPGGYQYANGLSGVAGLHGGGPLLLVAGNTATVAGLETSLVSGVGQAWNADLANHYWELRECRGGDINGFAAFTFELFYKPAAIDLTGPGVIARSKSNVAGTTAFLLQNDGSNKLQCSLTTSVSGLTTVTGSTTISAGTIYHVAVTYDGSTLRLFVGTPGNTSTMDTAAQTGTVSQHPMEEFHLNAMPSVDGEGSTTAGSFDGSIDSVRLSNVARYTAAFTAPAAKFTDDANTRLLLNFDQTLGPMVAATTRDGTAWLVQGAGNTSIPTMESYSIDRVSFTGGGGGAGIRSGLWIYGARSGHLNKLTFSACRNALWWDSAANGFWSTAKDISIDGFGTTRYGIHCSTFGGWLHLDSPSIQGCMVQIQTNNAPFVITNPYLKMQNESCVGLYCFAGDSTSGAISICGGGFDGEGQAPTNYVGNIYLHGAFLNADITTLGLGATSGTTIAPVVCNGAGSVSFRHCPFHLLPAITSVVRVISNPVNPIIFDHCTNSGGSTAFTPWSDTTGTAAVARIGPKFSSSTGNTLRFDAVLADEWDLTLTSDVTQSSWQSISYGQPVSGAIKMDSTGSRLFTWPTNSKGTVTLSYGSAAVNTFTGFYDGVNVILTSVRTGL